MHAGVQCTHIAIIYCINKAREVRIFIIQDEGMATPSVTLMFVEVKFEDDQ